MLAVRKRRGSAPAAPTTASCRVAHRPRLELVHHVEVTTYREDDALRCTRLYGDEGEVLCSYFTSIKWAQYTRERAPSCGHEICS